MSAVVQTVSGKAQKWLVAFGLLMAAFISTFILTDFGSAAWIPIACIVAVICALIKPEWTLLGFSSAGIKKVFGVIAVVTAMVWLSASNAALEKKQTDDALRIVDLGKSDVTAQAAELASANEGTLKSLQTIAPSLEASERDRCAVVIAEEAKRLEVTNKEKIAVVVAREKGLGKDDLDGHISAYKELIALAPGRTDFAEKLLELQTIKARQDEIVGSPEKGLELLNFNWSKGGFGTVMLLNATIKNTSTVAIKDLTIKCVHFAPSGTNIDSNTQTLYELIGPGKTRRFRNISMGFILSQASQSSCKIINAKVN
jgi:hypothetical protein